MSRVGGTSSGTVISFDISTEIDRLKAEQRRQRDIADQLTARVTAEDRDFKDDEQKAFDEARGNMVTIGKRVDRLENYAEERAKTDGRSGPKTGNPKPPKASPGRESHDEDGLTDEEREEAESNREERAAYRKAYRSWIRDGERNLNEEQRGIMRSHLKNLGNDPEERALSATTGSAGGYTVPQEFMNQIVAAMKDVSGVLKSSAPVIPTSSGADMPWPTVNDTTQTGELLGENTQAAAQDVTFGSVTLKGYMFSSKVVLVPLQLLQDTAVDIEAIIASLLGQRLGRILNSYLTTGTGTAQPQGIVVGSTLGVTAAGVAAITYNETLDLQHSVDPAYRGTGRCAYMFHDTTFKLLRKLVDGSSRPIWMPQASSGAAAGAPATLNGDPFIINQNMATPATGQKTMLYGDFSNYKVRQIRNTTLMRLTERYADYLQVGFLAFSRWDGRMVNAGTNAVTYLIQA